MIIGKFDPFKGEKYGVIDENGQVKEGAVLPPDNLLCQFYREMVLIRAADDKAFALQRQGRIGTYPQLKGNEALQIGAAHAMGPDDWLVPSYREHGLMYLRGMPIENIYLYWAGNEMGNYLPKETRILPIEAPVGSQTLHAVGIGMAATIRGEKLAVLSCFGEGATSEGEFHEAMNFAGTFKAPVVFLCSNNQFAISCRHDHQTAAPTYAQKAAAYGFDGIIVDGMDAVAVFQTVAEAMDRARSGGGPVFIEAVTYRLCDHTTSDDASIYRDPAELEIWMAREPVLRFKKFLEAKGLWSARDEEALTIETANRIEGCVAAFESTRSPTSSDIFESTYATLPTQLKWQLKDLQSTLSQKR